MSVGEINLLELLNINPGERPTNGRQGPIHVPRRPSEAIPQLPD